MGEIVGTERPMQGALGVCFESGFMSGFLGTLFDGVASPLINYNMKHKGLIFMVMMLMVFSVTLLGQDGTSPPADFKEFWELKKWTVILGGLLALIGLLKNTGLDQKLEKYWIGRLLLSTINLAIS